MAKEIVKDAYNTVLGSIETLPDGSQVLRSTAGIVRAYYDPVSDHTRGSDQKILAKGNVLSTLLC